MKTATQILLVCALTGLTAFATAQVFRSVDEDGNVVFSDIPPDPKNGKQAGSEEIEITAPNTYVPHRQAYTPEEGAQNSEGTGAYEPVQVISPGDDETVRENAGSISVSLAVPATLSSDHQLRVYLDDQVMRLSRENAFTLENVDRGTHTLRADIVDSNQKLVLRGEPSTFHLHRYSQLLNGRNKGQ